MLATELKAIGASGLIEVELDPAGWGQFLSLGYFLGDHAALAEVRRAPAASVMVYDPTDAAADEDHPDLNGTFVSDLKRGKGASRQILEEARKLLFYWHVWRWVMEGRLTVQRDGLFF